MPYASVTIEAQWEVENPKTGNSILYFLIILLIGGIVIYIIKEKANELN